MMVEFLVSFVAFVQIAAPCSDLQPVTRVLK